jgi:hypothetical protein
MALNPALVTVGTINSGATNINADVSGGLSSAASVAVLLSTAYTMLQPPGWPFRPGVTGAGAQGVTYPATIAAGTRIVLLAPEAAALVAAGAGTYD